MKAQTPQTIIKYLTGQKPIKLFRLIDVNGNTVLAWNTITKNKTKHIADLNDLLTSDAIADGVYFLQWRTTTRSEPQTITIHKGKIAPDAATTPAVPAFKGLSETVRSFDDALTDRTRIKELELENQSLKQQLAAMMDAENVEEIAEEPQTGNVVLTLLKDVGLPLLDKYFELKEREVAALSAARPSTQSPVMAPIPSGTATTSKPVPVKQPTIVPQQNQPQPQPNVQIVTGGGAAFPEQQQTQMDPDEQQLLLFIQETEPEPLRDWFMSLKNTEDAYTLHVIRTLIQQNRPDAGYIID